MKARWKQFAFKVFFRYLPASVLIYSVAVYVLVRTEANRDDARPADRIIVFGAAQYNGRPSPVFRARLDHGAELFKRKLSSRIITTGGYGLDPRFTEAEVGKAYLIQHGVPEDSIETEASGLTTLASIREIVEILRRQGIRQVVAVSDGFHLFRIKQIFRDRQVVVFGSPVPNSPIESNWKSRLQASLREVSDTRSMRPEKSSICPFRPKAQSELPGVFSGTPLFRHL